MSGSGFYKFYYIGSLLTAILAMFTKQNAITLPLMILLYEFTFLNAKKTLDWRFIFLFLLTAFIVPITMLFIKTQIFQDLHGDLNVTGQVITPKHYFYTQFRVMVTYIRLVFLPFNLNFDYDYPIYKTIFELPVLLSLLFLLIIFYWAKCLFLKYRLVSFSIFWFFLTLLPESSINPMGDVILEHRLYLPLAGYSIFLVSGLYYVLGTRSLRMMAIILIMLVGFNSVLTYQRNKVWVNELTLWDDTVGKSPNKARPHFNFAKACADQGDLAQALIDYNKAIELIPNYVAAYINRGVLYARQGNAMKALSDYNKAIGINPRFGVIYNNRACVYYQLKEYDKAWADVHKAEELGTVVKDDLLGFLKQASGRDK